MTHARVWIGLGSNLADPENQIRLAIDLLHQHEQINVVSRSSLYRSDPMGPPDQPEYINAVVAVETTLQPTELLDAAQAIENDSGRVRKERWGARTLDLDLLIFGDVIMNTDRLVLPHPGIASRSFVLIPLLEIAPAIVIPGLGQAADFLASVEDYGLTRMEIDSAG